MMEKYLGPFDLKLSQGQIEVKVHFFRSVQKQFVT